MNGDDQAHVTVESIGEPSNMALTNQWIRWTVESQRLLLSRVSPSVSMGNPRGGIMEAGVGGHWGWRGMGRLLIDMVRFQYFNHRYGHSGMHGPHVSLSREM